MKRRISVYLESSLLEQLEKVATRQKLTKSVSSSPRSLRFSPPTLPIDSRLPSRDVSIVSPASPNVLNVTWLLLPRRLLSSSGSGSPPRRRLPPALMRLPKPKAESDTEPSSRPSVGGSRRGIVSFKKYRKTCRRSKVIIRDRSQTDCDPDRRDSAARRAAPAIWVNIPSAIQAVWLEPTVTPQGVLHPPHGGIHIRPTSTLGGLEDQLGQQTPNVVAPAASDAYGA